MSKEDNIIKLPFNRRNTASKADVKAMHIADEFDRILIKHITDDDVEVKTLIGVMAHRLGAILNKIDRKDEMWEICKKVIVNEINK